MARIGIFDDLEPDEGQGQFMPAPIKRGNPNPPVTPPITSKATRPQTREQTFHQPLEVIIPAPQTSVAQQRLGLFDDLEAEPAQPQTVNIGAKGHMRPDDRVRPDATIPFLQGASLNASDEIMAGIGTPAIMAQSYLTGEGPTAPGEAYDQATAYADAQLAATQEHAPWTSTGLELAGALTTGKAPAQWALKAPTALGKAARSAVVGSGYGAASGFNRGDGFEDRTEQAGEGAVWGAGFGLAAPTIGNTLGKIVGKGVEASQNFWNAVVRGWRSSGVDERAARLVAGELEAAGLSPQQAQQELSRLGEEGMIADIASSIRQRVGQLNVRDPEAGQILVDRVQQRRLGGEQRVRQSLDEAYGPYRDPYDVQQATKADRQATGSLYRAAEGQSVGLDDAANYMSVQLKAFPKGPIANSLNQVRDLLTDNAGNFLSEAPQVHAARQQLDDMVSAAYRAGESKRGNVLRGLRERLDETLKTQVPGFAEADARYATAARQQEAFDRGRTEYFRGGPNTMTPAAAKADLAKASDAERDFIAQGQRAELERTLSNARASANAPVDRLLSRDFNEEKVAATIGPEKTGKLRSALDREGRFIETSNLVEPGRGSRTAQLMGDQLTNDPWKDKSVITDFLSAAVGGFTMAGPAGSAGAVLGVGAARAQELVRRALRKKGSDQLYRLYADYLSSTGKERDQLFRKLIREEQEAATKADKAQQKGERAEKAGAATAAAATLTAPNAFRDYLGGPRDAFSRFLEPRPSVLDTYGYSGSR